jgi:hypothetical protein
MCLARPPSCVVDISRDRDEVAATTLATIQQDAPPTQSSHNLPVGAGGGELTSPGRHASCCYLGAFSRIAGQLQHRLTTMGGSTNKAIMAAMLNPVAVRTTMEWAHRVCEAHTDAKRAQDSFSLAQLHTTDLMAPRARSSFRRATQLR